MSAAVLIAGRELRAYLRSPFGYIVAAATLLIDGLLFEGYALGAEPRLSADVLFDFFYFASGTTMVASILLSMRLLAEERQTGTLVLINTAPVLDAEIVLGKFLAAFSFVALLTALTVYMPLLILVNGKVSAGHILVGYAGLVLLAGASIAIGLFGSALAKTQVLAAILGAGILVTMLLLWLVARVTDPPLSQFLAGLALHNERQSAFMRGLFRLDNVVYYLVVTYVYLLAATKTL
ncbi:MAG: ABC transporter permease, partial [Myxococcales bacterium]|nr:ABC transporter permease [Myxococcales bacterium]